MESTGRTTGDSGYSVGPAQPQIVYSPKPNRKALWVAIGVVVAIFLMCGGLIAIIAAIGSSTPDMPTKPGKVVAAPTETKAAAPVKLKTHLAGEAAEFSGVNDLKGTMAISPAKMVNGKYGGRYLIVTVDISVESGKLDYNPFDYKLKGTDGTEYTPGLSMSDGELNSGSLTAGRKVKGVVAFEVPDSVLAGAEIEYAPAWDGALAYWKVG